MNHIIEKSDDNFNTSNYRANFMKILFTSDLHMNPLTVDDVLCVVRKKLGESNPDALVIAGDVSDIPSHNTFGFFSEFDLPVVFCLGNHEFAHSSVPDTLGKYKHDYEVSVNHGVTNVHCLDTEGGHFDTHGIRLYGNVLWYDGSLCNLPDKDRYMERIYEGWLDSSIRDFNPLGEHMNCVEQIKHAQRTARGRKLVLVTHCVPHRRLNLFDGDEPQSIFNTYSGVDNLFDSYHIHPDYALCGHTHRRVVYNHEMKGGKVVRCYNSGNDYFHKTGKIIFDELEV